MIHCPIYNKLRVELLPANILNLDIPDIEKFTRILNTGSSTSTTAKFVAEAFNLRKIRLDVLDLMDGMLMAVEKREHDNPIFGITHSKNLKLNLSKIHTYNITSSIGSKIVCRKI